MLLTALSGVFIVGAWIASGIGMETLNVAFYVTAIITGGYTTFRKAIPSLLRLNFGVNVLVTIAIIGAALIGEWAEAAIVVFLFGVSEALEDYSAERARESIRSLVDMAPKTALIRREGTEQEVKVEDIQVGDIMLVKPGDKIAMDGKIIKGATNINQAAITGESMPVEKAEQDEVFAGTLNGKGSLEVEVTKLVADTTLSKIIHLVEKAERKKHRPKNLWMYFQNTILRPLFLWL